MISAWEIVHCHSCCRLTSRQKSVVTAAQCFACIQYGFTEFVRIISINLWISYLIKWLRVFLKCSYVMSGIFHNFNVCEAFWSMIFNNSSIGIVHPSIFSIKKSHWYIIIQSMLEYKYRKEVRRQKLRERTNLHSFTNWMQWPGSHGSHTALRNVH